MRRISHFFFTFLFCVFGFNAGLDAQVNVAVVDLGVVFESHPTFVQGMESLKAEMTKYEQEHRVQQENLVAGFKQLSKLEPSSEQYRTREVQLTQNSASLEVQKKLKAREFMQKEASIYHSVYQDIQTKVRNFCRQNQIALVVHYNSEKMNTEDPRSVMTRINSNVIFARRTGGDIDITLTLQKMCGAKIRTANVPGGGQRR